jgi:hypothetical protein
VVTLVFSQVVLSTKTADSKTIPYKKIAEFENFEIRQYPQLTVATTELAQNNYDQISRVGFRRIASYIFGGNSDNAQIAMTSPVQMNIGESSNMSFFMPPNYKLTDLPTPDNSQVVLHNQEERTLAIISFSGWASDKMLLEKYEELKSLLKAQNIPFKEGYGYFGYNPPYQLINRVNEVTIELINYKQ